MKPTLATRMHAIAAGNVPTRRRHVLTAAQADAVRDIAVLVGRCLVAQGRWPDRALPRQPAPPELVGVLP